MLIKKLYYLAGYIEKEIMEIYYLLDLRDHYGITQCVIENDNEIFSILEKLKPESVLKISGKVNKERRWYRK